MYIFSLTTAPPRGESLDPKYVSICSYGCSLGLCDYVTFPLLQGALGNSLLNSFEDTLEFTASCSYCVAVYDYEKTNPNDMPLKLVHFLYNSIHALHV